MDFLPSQSERAGLQGDSTNHGRILASTSGNAQPFNTNHKSLLNLRRQGLVGERAVSDSHFPPTNLPILGSNDKEVLQERLAARKDRRNSHPFNNRPYLTNKKYLSYRERKRQDRGKDNKTIWPDHIEDSFQNALVQIPPMGKKKKTQYGRPHGRNELIAEWIFQETGEVRDRKQVSSHIQVLTGFLGDVPEWQAVTAKSSANEENWKDENGRDYYFESIADQVRIQRQLAQARKAEYESDTWPDLTYQAHSLSKLTFELWVGVPDNITQALHNYTRVSNHHSSLPEVPLEDFDNWRELFPNLESTLQYSYHGEFDVILVKSTMALMSDFPPQSSKLGLVLDLDFRNPGQDTIKALSKLKYWSSVNHMYLNGRPLRKTEHKECQSAEFGLVKPFFEADWWASHFTNLTHRRKEAENCNDETATAAADEYSRSLFRGLSIMQEVFATPQAEEGIIQPRRRMAVLLWVFSQANKGQSGTTSWQKLILPPNRLATHSPFAPPDVMDLSLPPLVLDSMIENSFSTMAEEHEFPQFHTESYLPLSPIIYEPGSYHSGFTPLQTVGTEHLKFYDFTATGFTPRALNLTTAKHGSFDFNTSVDAVPSFEQSEQDLLDYDDQMSNVFDGVACHDTQEDQSTNPVFHAREVSEAGSPDRRQCLANFDMSTHQMLQAQLDRDEPHEQSSLLEDDTIVGPESQQSVTGRMDNLGLDKDGSCHETVNDTTCSEALTSYIDEDQDMIALHPLAFESPKVVRPRLQHHNSFAGVLHTASGNNADKDVGKNQQSGFDASARNDFARLLSNQPDHLADGETTGNDNASEVDLQKAVEGKDIVRPRSQPVLPSSASTFGLPEDSLILDVSMQETDSIEACVNVEKDA